MNEKNKIRRVSKNLILGTSRATRGAFMGNMDLQSSSDPNATRADIVVALSKTSMFEKIWYPTFFIAGILCLIFIRPFNFNLCFAVASLIIYLFANNLLARGKILGLILSITSSVLYVVVSFFAKVYGEVIINVLLYIPLDVIAVITFKKNRNKDSSEVDVKQMEYTTALIFFGATLLMFGVVFLILYFIPGQVYPVLNSLSIVLFLMALIVRNFRYKEFWWFNLFGNVVSIVLWAVVATSGAELLFGLPMALSSLAALLNNIFGIIMWQKMYRKEVVNGGVYINRRVKISEVIKVRKRYQDYLRWDREAEEKRSQKLKAKGEK